MEFLDHCLSHIHSSLQYRNPIVSFVYERGWRQTFKQSGFPGRDEEVVLSSQTKSLITFNFLFVVALIEWRLKFFSVLV